MNSHVLSGAQKRKRAAKEKEKISKLPKQTSWLKPNSTTPSGCTVSSDAPSTSTVSEVNMIASSPDLDAEDIPQEESPESLTVKEFEIKDTDPGKWNIKDIATVDYWVRIGPSSCQNSNSYFSDTSRVYKDAGGAHINTRYLSKNVFERKLRNGECIKREWLLYSPSQGRLYCFVCRLLSDTESPFTISGFNDWKHSANIIGEHENGIEHQRCMRSYLILHEESIDSPLIEQYRSKQEYWHKVLTRVVSVVQFLASRGLPFYGDNQIIGSPQNGNYLGILELISKFDPFLEEHLSQYGNSEKVNPYSSVNICDEFIESMGQKVLKVILEEINESRYYTISVDSTSDISHIDHLTFTIRYIKGSEPVERFLQFIPLFCHGAKHLGDKVIEFLKENEIPLSNCYGLSYDNASNMSGRYTGLQARIQELNAFAIDVPCAGHSLNLVGVKAVENSMQSVNFFDFIQHLYSFFSVSTYRWNILVLSLEECTVIRHLSDTRWSSHFDAVHALYVGFEKIQHALNSIASDTEQDVTTRGEAKRLSKKMDSLETIYLAILWNDILERINTISSTLQSMDVDILIAMDLLSSLKSYLQEVRNKFTEYELKAKNRCPDLDYNYMKKREQKRNMSLARYGPEEETPFNASEQFKAEVFLPILDSLISELTKRAEAYSLIGNRFSFLSEIKTINSGELTKKCEHLANVYHQDIDYNDLLNECIFLQDYISSDENCDTPSALYKIIISDNLKAVFPTVEIALRLFLSMMVTNCTEERSISRLKLIKNELHSTMGQQHLNWLSLMFIGNDILTTIDFEATIKQFTAKKMQGFMLRTFV